MDVLPQILPVYKPSGMNSHDVVDMVREVTGVKKVGHAGTLDPLATGVLVVGIRRAATRRLSEWVQAEKEYLAQVRLGAMSTTADAEGLLIECVGVEPPSNDEVCEIIERFTGTIMQVPPKFSAVKHEGERAYRLARAGKEFELEPREREVMQIYVVDYDWPELELRVVTGKGVYIRSLARDIGNELAVGGYLTGLERTRVGQYGVSMAVPLDELEDVVNRVEFLVAQ